MNRKIFKSIGIILLAFIISGLLSVITDFILEKIGVLPDPQQGLFEPWLIVVVLIYRGFYTILAGYIVAKLAPGKPMMHALILGIIGTVITIIGTNSASFSDKSPLWFGYTLALLTIPCLLLGVKIQENWKFDYKNANH